jgi:hypothetical protein
MLQSQGSVVVNGQLVGAIPAVSQYVTGFAPYSAVSPAGPLTIPPTVGNMALGGGFTPTGTADSNSQAVENAKSDPFNPKKSPVIPALVALGLALFMLHAVHFREEGRASAAGESASESVD